MTCFIPFALLAQMPPAKAAALKARAHVIDKHGIRLPRQDVDAVNAGLLETPEMQAAAALDDFKSPLLGDRLESFFKKVGVAKAMDAYTQWRGKKCKCPERRDALNAIDAKVRQIAAGIIGGDA